MTAVQISSKRKKWATQQSKELINERNILREKAKNTQEQEDLEVYRRVKNKCTKNIKKNKTQYHKNMFLNCEKYAKKLFRTASDLLGWEQRGNKQHCYRMANLSALQLK